MTYDESSYGGSMQVSPYQSTLLTISANGDQVVKSFDDLTGTFFGFVDIELWALVLNGQNSSSIINVQWNDGKSPALQNVNIYKDNSSAASELMNIHRRMILPIKTTPPTIRQTFGPSTIRPYYTINWRYYNDLRGLTRT